MEVNIKKTKESAIIPTYATEIIQQEWIYMLV